jgi:hypothetical protein
MGGGVAEATQEVEVREGELTLVDAVSWDVISWYGGFEISHFIATFSDGDFDSSNEFAATIDWGD